MLHPRSLLTTNGLVPRRGLLAATAIPITLLCLFSLNVLFLLNDLFGIPLLFPLNLRILLPPLLGPLPPPLATSLHPLPILTEDLVTIIGQIVSDI